MKRLWQRALALRGSVRARLMLWNVCALAIILSLLGGIIQYTVRHSLLASVDRELAARTPKPHNPPPGGPMGPPPGDRMRRFGPRREERDRDPFGWHFIRPDVPADNDPRHQPWDAAALKIAARGRPVYSTVRVKGVVVRVFSQPGTMDGNVVVIQNPYVLTDINHAISVMNRALLALIPVALVLAGLGGAILTGRALRPVQNLARAAEGIDADELSRRLTVTGNDEFSHLTRTFNRMLARLETSFDQREALVRQLESLIETQRRFAADASHELKTPLTIVKANTSFLLRTEELAPSSREALEDVDAATDAMNRLVQDLLLLACHDGGQLGQNRVALPIGEVLERVIGRTCAPDGPDVHLDCPDGGTLVCGNEDEVARLFTNLLTNAIRYTPATGRIDVAVRCEGERVTVAVADTGCGIAPEHLPHLGTRFYRVDAARSRPDGGTGLGLSICKSIVEAHQGLLTFESELGKGTTVFVALPGAEAPDEEG